MKARKIDTCAKEWIFGRAFIFCTQQISRALYNEIPKVDIGIIFLICSELGTKQVKELILYTV